jgi:hypothetical protein
VYIYPNLQLLFKITLKKEVACSSETSDCMISTQKTTIFILQMNVDRKTKKSKSSATLWGDSILVYFVLFCVSHTQRKSPSVAYCQKLVSGETVPADLTEG